MTIESLAEALDVSKYTIRRDLTKLEEKNVIKRTYGGAVLLKKQALSVGYNERLTQLQLTTVQAVIPFLDGHGIYGITNSLTIAQLLAQLSDSEISLLPGRLSKEQLFLYGADTVKKLEHYNVDYTLLGVFAINRDGIFVHTEEEGLVKRQMIKNTKKVIALADHTKLDTVVFFKACELSEIDILITDSHPDEAFKKALEAADVELVIIN